MTRQAHTLNSGILAMGSRAVLVSMLAGDSQKWKGTNTVPGRTRAVTLAEMLMTPRRVSTLTTGRMLEHYHTGTMTRRSDGLNELVPTGFVEVHPDDASRLGVNDGAEVTLETRRGTITVPAYVTVRVRPGTVFVPFHFWESPANRLTNPARDPMAKIPEFKVCACRLQA